MINENDKIWTDNYFKIAMDVFLNYMYKDNITYDELMMGLYYKYLHGLYACLGVFLLLFNNNLYHLSLVLFYITMNAFAVVVYQKCPLNEFEEKYTKESVYFTRLSFLKLFINYTCNHEYEHTIEILMNAWTLVCVKCFLILALKTFQFKVYNFNNIYCV